MEARRRKVSPPGASNLKKSESQAAESNECNQSSSTRLVVQVLVVCILSCIGVVKLIPDHPGTVALLSQLDSSLTTLGLCQAVYAVVLDAGSTG